MKKLLLFSALVFALAFQSCSDDSDTPRSVLTARVNGVDKVFNTVNVEVQPYEGYTDLAVTASINNSPVERISFVVEQGKLGLDASWYFAYFLNETWHPKMPGFQTSVTESTEHKIIGTFAGQVETSDTGEIVTLENGKFNVYY